MTRIRHQHYQPTVPADEFPLLDGDLFAPQVLHVYQDSECPTYTGSLDGERLTSQLDAVLALMADNQWRTLSEIRAAIGRGSEAGLSARLREIRNSRRGVVERRRRGDPKNGLHEYRLIGLTR